MYLVSWFRNMIIMIIIGLLPLMLLFVALLIAAGKGIKEGVLTPRIIRQVDVAPTVAIATGVRMPAQCEGAPAYQLFEGEY